MYTICFHFEYKCNFNLEMLIHLQHFLEKYNWHMMMIFFTVDIYTFISCFSFLICCVLIFNELQLYLFLHLNSSIQCIEKNDIKNVVIFAKQTLLTLNKSSCATSKCTNLLNKIPKQIMQCFRDPMGKKAFFVTFRPFCGQQ